MNYDQIPPGSFGLKQKHKQSTYRREIPNRVLTTYSGGTVWQNYC